MNDMSDWFVVSPTESFNLLEELTLYSPLDDVDDSNETKNVEEVHTHSVEKNSSERLSRTENIPEFWNSNSSCPRTEKMQEKLNNPKKAVDASTNTEEEGGSLNINSTATFYQRNEIIKELSQVVKKMAVNSEQKDEFTDDILCQFSVKRDNCGLFVSSLMITICVMFPIAIIIGLPRILPIQDLGSMVYPLKVENDLLKQQLLHYQRTENERLEVLTRRIFEQLNETENASKNCQKQAEVESFYQVEINQLKEQVFYLEGDYKALQNRFKEVYSIVEQTRNKDEELPDNGSRIDYQMKHSDVYLENFKELIMLYNKKLNLIEIEAEPDQDCFESSFVGNAFNFSRIFSYFTETLNSIKNNILEKGIALNFIEYIHALKDVILSIFSHFLEILNIIGNYITGKDRETIFVYAQAFNDKMSTTYKSVQRFFICLEQDRENTELKRKIEGIRFIMDSLLDRLEDINTDIKPYN